MQKISLAIVDDEPCFREGAGWALSDSPDVEVIACARSARELIATLDRVKPQVILLGGAVDAALQAVRPVFRQERYPSPTLRACLPFQELDVRSRLEAAVPVMLSSASHELAVPRLAA